MKSATLNCEVVFSKPSQVYSWVTSVGVDSSKTSFDIYIKMYMIMIIIYIPQNLPYHIKTTHPPN